MASNVVVIDSSFRRATIKVQPGTYMSDVLEEGCKKLNLRPQNYGLKLVSHSVASCHTADVHRHNKKNLDLSLTWRLTSLPSGAQLELVQSSRSPSIVDVALQLPQSENNARLTDKFPSTTTFWQLLRRFESGVAGGAKNLNITQRGVPQPSGSSSGGGRLNYEMPVVHVQNRELASVEDLQKTLAQIGVNSGRVLVRLSFKNSGKPLEEVMAEISQYFKESESNETPAKAQSTDETNGALSQTEPQEADQRVVTDPQPEASASRTVQETANAPDILAVAPENSEQSIQGPDSRPMLVYSAPTDNAPQASRFETGDSDFEPTVAHAKLHQARLNTESRNKRLPSDKEIQEAEQSRQERLTAVKEVRIRVRLPDQTSVESTFTRDELASKLYAWVRSMMELSSEPFTLRYMGPKGQQVGLIDGQERLVADLSFQGRTLVNFTWDENASVKARKTPLLKEQWRKQAQAMKVDVPTPSVDLKQAPSGYDNAKPAPKKSSGADMEQKLKNLLGFGKKK